MSTGPDLVTLPGAGPTVTLEAVEFLLALEERGFIVRRDGYALVISPGRYLTSSDRDQIQRLRPSLIAIVDYVDGRVQ